MVFLIIIVVLIIAGCDGDRSVQMPEYRERVTSFRLKEFSGTDLRWELEGTEAREKGDTIVVSKLHIDFYDENRRKKSTITSDSGYVFMQSNNLKALGNVVVETGDSSTLWTEELNWDNKEEKIKTDRIIKYKKGRNIYRGKGLESDPDLNRIIIREKFEGEGEFE